MTEDFLSKLQKEAELQQSLNQKRIFPEAMDGITSFIGNYSFQTLIVLSFISVTLVEVFN